jgi:hypothetical protein
LNRAKKTIECFLLSEKVEVLNLSYAKVAKLCTKNKTTHEIVKKEKKLLVFLLYSSLQKLLPGGRGKK